MKSYMLVSDLFPYPLGKYPQPPQYKMVVMSWFSFAGVLCTSLFTRAHGR